MVALGGGMSVLRTLCASRLDRSVARRSISQSKAASPSDPKPRVRRVVCIGWFGANSRHLAKYGEAWRRLGVDDVICYRPSVLGVLFRTRGEQEARQFLENLPTPQSSHHLTVWHVLSQGGFTFFGSLLVQSRSEKEKARIASAAVVFDSGPCLALTERDAVVGVLTGLLSGYDENDVLLAYNSKVFRYVWDRGFQVYRLVYDPRTEAILSAFTRHVTAPQYYLYSAQDKVIPAPAVEAFIARQRGEKRTVAVKKFESGKHVQLLREHGEEYLKCLRSVLEDLNQTTSCDVHY